MASQHGSATLRLWRRAPAWRWSLILALLGSASFVALPPPRFGAPAPQIAAPSNLGPVAEFTPTLPPRVTSDAEKPPLAINHAPTTPQAVAVAPSPPSQSPPAPAAKTFYSAKALQSGNPQAYLSHPRLPPPVAPTAPPSGVATLTRPDPGLLSQPGMPPMPHNPDLGGTYTGIYPILGRRVPLPAGKFEALAYITGQIGNTIGATAVLGRIENNRLAAAVLIITTPANAKIGTGFRRTPDCLRSNIFYKEIVSDDDFGPQDCFLITHAWLQAFRSPNESNAIKSFVTALDTRGVPLPPAMVFVQFHLANRDGFLRVAYYLNPEMRGITSRATASWAESDWYKNYLAQDPKKLAYMNDARAWAQRWHPYMENAFAGTLRDAPPQQLASTLP